MEAPRSSETLVSYPITTWSLHPEDGGSMVPKTLVSYHNTAWHHNPKDLDLNLHCCENLKSHIWVWFEKYL